MCLIYFTLTVSGEHVKTHNVKQQLVSIINDGVSHQHRQWQQQGSAEMVASCQRGSNRRPSHTGLETDGDVTCTVIVSLRKFA